nr:DUF2071 domain-containing protein [Streptomyces sp. 2323.1]
MTADPIGSTENPLLTQSWLDLAFLHWAVDPSQVAHLLPTGTVPDTFDGATHAGLVPCRMHRAELVTCDEGRTRAAGLRTALDAPISVLYSPGATVRFGRPARSSHAGGIPAP